MEFAFPWPTSTGEWLAWISAVITVVFGVVLLVAPAASFRLLRLRTAEGHPEALSEGRATMAGFYLGVGLTALLFAQPFLYLALGASWLFTAAGRLISIIVDRGSTGFNWVSLAMELALALLPLVFVLGYVA